MQAAALCSDVLDVVLDTSAAACSVWVGSTDCNSGGAAHFYLLGPQRQCVHSGLAWRHSAHCNTIQGLQDVPACHSSSSRLVGTEPALSAAPPTVCCPQNTLLILLPHNLSPLSWTALHLSAGSHMANRPHPQHRLRLLVHQATPSGSPSGSVNSGTLQSNMGTPVSSPTKAGVAVTQQQQQQDGQGAGGGSNPQWWMLVRGRRYCWMSRVGNSTSTFLGVGFWGNWRSKQSRQA